MLKDTKFTVNQPSVLNPIQFIRHKTKDIINHLSTNFTKWSNILKQLMGKLPANCLSVFDHFVGLALKGLILIEINEFDYGALIS